MRFSFSAVWRADLAINVANRLTDSVTNRYRDGEAKRVLRFLLFGTIAAAINWLVRMPLSSIMPFSLAVILAYGIGMSAGFTLYRKYVFPSSSRSVANQVKLFLAVNLVGAIQVWLIAMVLVFYLFPRAGFNLFPEAIGHGIAIAVGAVTSYLGHKYLTFSSCAK